MARTTPKFNPFDDPLYDPIKDEEEGPRTYIGEGDPGQGFNFSDFMTAADAEELFRNMDTGQIEANVLQKMGVPDFLTNTQVQDAINQALGATDFLSQEDVARMIAQQGGPDLSGYATSSDISNFLSQEQISNMIANAQMQGMTEQQIMDMIKQVTGGQMSDDAIRELVANQLAGLESDLDAMSRLQEGFASAEEVQSWIEQAFSEGFTAEQIQSMIGTYLENNPMEGVDTTTIQQMIADATAGVPGMEEIQRMIDEGLANGLSPEEINQMISEYLASNPIEGITAEGVQQMIADAIAALGGGESGEEGMSMEDIQALLDSGYMTADQINALMSDAGYLGQEGVDSSVQAALDAALGEGGAINSAIAAAMQSQGGGQTPPTDTDMNFTQPYTPGSFPTNPYGNVNPYALMQGQFAGTTPFSGGTTTGAEMPTGLGTLNLGDPSQYNFDIPTTPGADLYPSGIDPRYFNPPTPNRRLPEPPTTPPEESGYRLPPDFFNTYGG